jgi:hypothetical protein
MDEGVIDIAGLDKAQLLAALYNGSRQLGMGFIHAEGRKDMTVEQAREQLPKGDDHAWAGHGKPLYFDYLHGRVMKVDLSGDTLRPFLYDRDNGEGAAARIIERLRNAR